MLLAGQIVFLKLHSGNYALSFLAGGGARTEKSPFDPNAIQVRRIIYADSQDKKGLGEQLGYVSRELAEKLTPKMDKDGFVLMVRIMEITGVEGCENFGVNIQIEEYRPAKQSVPRHKKVPTA
jgi:hypothetical protein